MDDEILEIVQELGEEVFEESQRLCPEGSGWLKNSGQLISNMGGFEIIYEAPHARLIHDGKETEEQYYEMKVKEFQRRNRNLKGALSFVVDTKGIQTGNPERQKPRQGTYSDLKSLLNIKKKSNTHKVKAHTKKYFGRRPILNKETGKWSVVNTTAKAPEPFIDDAYSKVIRQKKYKDISRDLGITFPRKLARGRQEVLRRFLSI